MASIIKPSDNTESRALLKRKFLKEQSGHNIWVYRWSRIIKLLAVKYFNDVYFLFSKLQETNDFIVFLGLDLKRFLIK